MLSSGFFHAGSLRRKMNLQLTRQDFENARTTIDELVHRTPVFSSRSLSERTGLRVWLKAENFQKTGSFKVRGAFNMVLHLSSSDRSRGIISASAGNHGQAIAYVSSHQKDTRLRGDAGEGKPEQGECRQGVRRGSDPSRPTLGRRLCPLPRAGRREGARLRASLQGSPHHGWTGNRLVWRSARSSPDLDAVLIPIGGGGLIAGIAMALRILNPKIRIIGVEPEGSANMYTSRRNGAATDLQEVTTSTDGLATKATDPDVFRCIDQTVDDLVTVTDDEIRQAIPFLLERAKLVAEPAGAATVAALLERKVSLPEGSRTVALVSGGNLDVKGSVSLSV